MGWDTHELTKMIHRMAPDSSVQLGFLQGGQEKIAGLVLGQLPSQPAAANATKQ
jgi:hypothetical protein